jgi:hypothetical protein
MAKSEIKQKWLAQKTEINHAQLSALVNIKAYRRVETTD